MEKVECSITYDPGTGITIQYSDDLDTLQQLGLMELAKSVIIADLEDDRLRAMYNSDDDR